MRSRSCGPRNCCFRNANRAMCWLRGPDRRKSPQRQEYVNSSSLVVRRFTTRHDATPRRAEFVVKQNACINQLARAQAEYAPAGYVVRGTIVTHINVFEPPVDASADSIRVVFKDAMIEL